MPGYIDMMLRKIAENPKYHENHPSILDGLSESKTDKEFKSSS